MTRSFEKFFSKRSLTKTYNDIVSSSTAVGHDNYNRTSFSRDLADHVRVINRKARKGTYKLTKYKLKLISKGPEKPPRVISIPTFRDRVAIRALLAYLTSVYKNETRQIMPQVIIAEIKDELASGSYREFLKVDIQEYYPSISHALMKRRLSHKRIDTRALKIIQGAIRNPTVSHPTKADQFVTEGVPQGIAISNALASIYLHGFDQWAGRKFGKGYQRYVDDILILCKRRSGRATFGLVEKKLRQMNLKPHPLGEGNGLGKTRTGPINQTIPFLGYEITGPLVTVRRGSLDNIRNSLISLFTAYKNSTSPSKSILRWKLDLRITGCVINKESKGWLVFFSEINDLQLLFRLDAFVCSLKKRFGVQFKSKKFSRVYHEIANRRHETSYIPNFDRYNVEDMRSVLRLYFRENNTSKMTDRIVKDLFFRRIRRETKEMERDIGEFS